MKHPKMSFWKSFLGILEVDANAIVESENGKFYIKQLNEYKDSIEPNRCYLCGGPRSGDGQVCWHCTNHPIYSILVTGTEYEKTKFFLNMLEVEYTEEEDEKVKWLSCKTGTHNVIGYNDFVAEFTFTKDGDFLSLGIWEE